MCIDYVYFNIKFSVILDLVSNFADFLFSFLVALFNAKGENNNTKIASPLKTLMRMHFSVSVILSHTQWKITPAASILSIFFGETVLVIDYPSLCKVSQSRTGEALLTFGCLSINGYHFKLANNYFD